MKPSAVLRKIHLPKRMISRAARGSQRKRLGAPGRNRRISASFAAAPTIAPMTSAQTERVAQARITSATTPIAWPARSSTVTRPSSRWRLAVSIRVGLKPAISSDSPAAGSSAASCGAS